MMTNLVLTSKLDIEQSGDAFHHLHDEVSLDLNPKYLDIAQLITTSYSHHVLDQTTF